MCLVASQPVMKSVSDSLGSGNNKLTNTNVLLGRAECVAMYLGGDPDILEIFGFGEDSEIKGEDGMYR